MIGRQEVTVNDRTYCIIVNLNNPFMYVGNVTNYKGTNNTAIKTKGNAFIEKEPLVQRKNFFAYNYDTVVRPKEP